MGPNMTIVQDRKRGLYPEIEPFNRGRLKVSSIHEIYFEEAGKKLKAVQVNGGSGCVAPTFACSPPTTST